MNSDTAQSVECLVSNEVEDRTGVKGKLYANRPRERGEATAGKRARRCRGGVAGLQPEWLALLPWHRIVLEVLHPKHANLIGQCHRIIGAHSRCGRALGLGRTLLGALAFHCCCCLLARALPALA